MKRRWIYGGTAVILLAFTLTALYALPYLTVWRLREAAAMGDEEAIARHVNLEQLRSNVEGALSAALTQQEGTGGLAGAFGRQLATTLVRNVTDVVVTPEGIGSLMRGEVPMLPTASNGAATLSVQEMGYEDASTFVVSLSSEPSAKSIALVLQRDGLTWKLSDVRLPL